MNNSIEVSVTLSLHPQNIRSIQGYNESTAQYVSAVESAFSEAYQGLIAIHEARKAIKQNPTLNDAAQLVAVAEFAEKRQSRITRSIDSASVHLKKGIDALEEQLSAPLQDGASASVTAEIRAHVKGLSLTERSQFLSDAQAAGDWETLEAVLGAPAYLSGISADEKNARTHAYRRTKMPELAQRLDVMKKAFDLLVERSPLIFRETEKAMGSNWSCINQIRADKKRSDDLVRSLGQ